MPREAFQDYRCQCSCPWAEPLLTHASTGDPPTLAGSFASVSSGVTAPFLCVLVRTRFCVCPPRLQSLFPPGLWKSYNQILLAFKVGFPGVSHPLCWIPRLGSPTLGLEPSQQWENFFGIIVLQFLGHPAGGHRIWFYQDCAPPTVLLWLLFFQHGESVFGGFQCLPVDGYSTASVIVVLSQEEKSTHSSTLPSWTGRI